MLAWPDFVVAGVMGTLGLTAAPAVVRHAKTELANIPQAAYEKVPAVMPGYRISTNFVIDRLSP